MTDREAQALVIEELKDWVRERRDPVYTKNQFKGETPFYIRYIPRYGKAGQAHTKKSL